MPDTQGLKALVLFTVGRREIQIQARESFTENVGHQQGLWGGRQCGDVERGDRVWMGVSVRCLGTEGEALLPCGWVWVVQGTDKEDPLPGGSGALARVKSEALENGREEGLRGVSICEAIIIFHILEDKYCISPLAASSHSTLPKCSVLPIFRSLSCLMSCYLHTSPIHNELYTAWHGLWHQKERTLKAH